MTAPHPEHLVGEDGEFITPFAAAAPKKQTADYITWVERLYDTRAGRWFGSPGLYVLMAIGVYVSGLLVAAALNTTEGYMRSPAIFLEVFGIPMVIAGIHVLARAIDRMISALGQIAAGPEEYHSYIAYWKRKMAGVEITLIALMGTVLFTVAIVGAVNIAFDLGEGPFREGMMNPALLRYSYQMILHGYLILLIGIALSELFKLVFGTIWLMRTLKHLPVIQDTDAVVSSTQHMLTVTLTGAFVWTLAAVFFGILLTDTLSQGELMTMVILMNPAILLFLTGVGLVRRLRAMAGYRRPPFAAVLSMYLMMAAALLSPLLSGPVQQFLLRVIAPTV